MKKLGVVLVFLVFLAGCEQGATRTEVAELRSRIDQVGQAVNLTHAACTGEEPPQPADEGEPSEPEAPEEEPRPSADRSFDEGGADPLAFAPTVRIGRVARTTGESGVAVGDRCDVAVWHVFDDQPIPANCRVRVRCGTREIYGPETGPASTDTWGWLLCSVRDGRADEAYDGAGIDEEEDPLLRMDLSANEVRVSDEGYEIELRLDPESRGREATDERHPEASGPSTGAAPSYDPFDFAPAVRFGQVSAVTGTPPGGTPLARGAACVVQVWPTGEHDEDGPINGRVNVLCGESNLYGPAVGEDDSERWGFLLVGVRGGQAAMAVDVSPTSDGGDPQLDLDLVGGRAVVADGETYRVEITLTR